MDTTRAQTSAGDEEKPLEDIWCLTIAHHREPQHIGKRLLVVEDASVFIGRGPGAFDDDRISRKHAEVHAEEDGTAWIRDCGSRNGTTVNGASVERRSIADGDVVGVGKILFVVHKTSAVIAPIETSLVGVSRVFADVLAQIDKVAKRDTAVLFSGPPGVGKTALARELHARSGRTGALTTIHCGAIADAIVHDELYGHEKGSFAGATTARVGLLEAAHEGTILLDHVEAASRKLQLALMQLLDTGEIRRMGSNKPKTIQTRVVATAALPLEELVAAERLPRDFADRLGGWQIRVPPLAERLDDIGPLAFSFAQRFAGEGARLDPELVLHLLRRPWPGNVRELEAAVEEAVVDSSGDALIGLPAHAEALTQPPEMVIARSGEWFESATSARVALTHRQNLVRILRALVAQREAHADVPLTVRELTDAGWPGENPLEKSGANRVYVAITTLRRLGLRDVIARERDGYYLRPGARIEISAA